MPPVTDPPVAASTVTLYAGTKSTMYALPVVTARVGPTSEGVYPTESFSLTTGNPTTENVPGRVVTLIHGVWEL